MSDVSAAALRPTPGFALEGLSGRDETLFKAIVRLLVDATSPLPRTISAMPHGAHCLGLPLRADALEAELNRLGVERMKACGFGPVAFPASTVRLLRWPPDHLLGAPERLRLANLMVTKPVTLAWVQQRAGHPPAAAPSGLLARIRSCLGILVRTSVS